MMRAVILCASSWACASACAAFSPMFFQRLMVHCQARAVAASVLPPASFRMLATSSVSRIENVGFRPSASPSWRSMRTPKA